MKLGALILTGGASSRMGEDKAAQDWGGLRAVDRLVVLAKSVGAEPVLTVGGPAYGYPHVKDRVACGGPVGGIMDGFAALLAAGAHRALVLAADAPTLGIEDLRPLLSAPAPGAAYDGFPLPLVMDRASMPPDAERGWPIRRFIARCGLALLPSASEARSRLKGANTPAERDALLGSPEP